MGVRVGALFVSLGAGSAAFSRDMRKASDALRSNAAKINRSLGAIQSEFAKVGKKMKRLGKSMSLSITDPLLLIGASILRVAGGFEKSMKKIEALTGATGKSLDAMREQAKQLGISTQFSASQAADAMGFLAQAGFDANEILAATPGILELAAAGELELAEATDIASNVLTQFGLKASEIGRVNDVLAKTASTSNTDIRQLAESMKFVGTTANQMGISVEATAAALGVMGNAGLQGSIAGTSLKQALMALLKPTGDQIAMQEQLGVTLNDSSGKMRSMTEIIETLKSKGATATQILTAFGIRGGRAISALVAQSGALRESVAANFDAAGAAGEQASKQMEGFEGAMKGLWSAIEGVSINIGEAGFLGLMTSVVKTITEWARWLAEVNPTILKWGTILGGIALVLGPLLIVLGLAATAIAALVPVVGLATGAFALVSLRVVAIVAALGAAGVAFFVFKDEIMEAFKAIGEFVGEKVTAIVAALGAAGAAFFVFKDEIMEAFKAIGEFVGEKVTAIVAALGEAGAAFFVFKDEIMEAFRAIGEFVGEKVTAMMGWIGGLVDSIKTAARAVARVFSGGGKSASPGAPAAAPGPTPGFRHGGQFRVGGAGGFDSQLVQFKATPGEMVTITNENDLGGGGGPNITINAPYADAGVERRIMRALERVSDRALTGGGLTDALDRGAFAT